MLEKSLCGFQLGVKQTVNVLSQKIAQNSNLKEEEVDYL